ncbi:hypothetical protein AGR1C_Cc10640 [Agrobacterium fabacearum TT111]|nr:hypothetical protein AGR1C_Cc10640 [Agrobacterium fabacearum TT111]
MSGWKASGSRFRQRISGDLGTSRGRFDLASSPPVRRHPRSCAEDLQTHPIHFPLQMLGTGPSMTEEAVAGSRRNYTSRHPSR